MTYEIKLKVFDAKYVLTDDSLRVLSKQIIEILEQDRNKFSDQAIKFVKQQRFFFRIDRSHAITCEMNKL